MLESIIEVGESDHQGEIRRGGVRKGKKGGGGEGWGDGKEGVREGGGGRKEEAGRGRGGSRRGRNKEDG